MLTLVLFVAYLVLVVARAAPPRAGRLRLLRCARGLPGDAGDGVAQRRPRALGAAGGAWPGLRGAGVVSAPWSTAAALAWVADRRADRRRRRRSSPTARPAPSRRHGGPPRRRRRRLRAPADPRTPRCSPRRASSCCCRSRAEAAAHLLVFLSPGCGPCGRIGPLARRVGRATSRRWRSGRSSSASRRCVERADLTSRGHAYFDPFGIARAAFGVGSPAAVLLGTDGMLAGGPGAGRGGRSATSSPRSPTTCARRARPSSRSQPARRTCRRQRRPVSSQASSPPSSSP